jgi:hypothetical protein
MKSNKKHFNTIWRTVGRNLQTSRAAVVSWLVSEQQNFLAAPSEEGSRVTQERGVSGRNINNFHHVIRIWYGCIAERTFDMQEGRTNVEAFFTLAHELDCEVAIRTALTS